ncbi:response regulator [Bacteroidota bacterium]
MKKSKKDGSEISELRKMAEKKLDLAMKKLYEIPDEVSLDIQKVLHELNVHQIELEMQNDELHRAQLIIEESRQKLFDLYNLAPVAYFTFDDKGNILDLNLTAAVLFGHSRKDFLKKNFNFYIERNDRNKFYLHLKNVFLTGNSQSCELRLLAKDGVELYGLLESVIVQSVNDQILSCRTVVINITERKKAESALKASEEFNAKILASSYDCIKLLDLKGNLLFISEGGQKLLEIEDVSTVLNTCWTDFWKEEENAKANSAIAKAKQGSIGQFQAFCPTQKGTPRYWDVVISPICDNEGNVAQLLAISRDITERIRNEKIQKVIYNIVHATIVSDNLNAFLSLIQKELGKIINTSNFYVALYDNEEDAFSLPFIVDEKETHTSLPAGKTLTNYIVKYNQSLLGTKKRIKELEERGEIESFGADAEIWMGVPLSIEGKLIGVLAVQSYTDENAYNESDLEILEFVSSQISISIERKKAVDDLKDALHKATESDRLKSSFLATMSHELRTPLNAIIGFSDIINENVPLEKIVRFTKTINSCGKDLLGIIKNLFDISLIESGESTLSLEDFYLHPIMNNIHEVITEESQRRSVKKVNIEFNVMLPQQELLLHSDSLKIKQILINLLRNAFKFTQEGYVRYGYSVEEINNKEFVRFFVEDSGIGIKKEDQKFIFDAFRQIDESNTRTYGGAGIGLSVASRLTSMLGGDIWLESKEGAGTTFYFTIPYKRPDILHKDIRSNGIETSKLKGMTILIVEDDESSYEYLKTILEHSDMKTLWAKDGEVAIKNCTDNPDIALVLMDINMPVLNGYEATQEIKKFRPDLPIISQTAYAISGDKEKSMNAGCDDYISKPIKKELLLEKISGLL